MTREEREAAVERLNALKQFIGYDKDSEIVKETQKSLDMAIEALKQEPEPVYFPPCVDCQNRMKEILIAYENMKKMQTYTKEEVITMLDKIRAEIEHVIDYTYDSTDYDKSLYNGAYKDGLYEALDIIDKYRESEE